MKRIVPISLAAALAALAPSAAPAQGSGARCGELPQPVAETRERILAAAESGSVEDLAALADSTEFTSNYGGEETLAYWQYLEREGEDIRETAKALLALGCSVSADDDTVFYTWPAAVDLPYSELTNEEREAIGALHGGAIEDVYLDGPEVGYYAGWSLLITSDGRWFALVAGD
jgi:hypothetical protein